MKASDPTYNQMIADKEEELICSNFDIYAEVDGVLDTHLIPKQLTDGGAYFCLEGEAEFILDLKSHKLKAGDMCVAFPFSILQTVRKSDDFKGFGVGISTNLFSDIQIPSAMDYYLHIKEDPCISLQAEDQKMLLDLCQQMMRKYSCVEHPFRQEIAKSLFKVVYFEIAAIYKKSRPTTQEYVSRKDMLVRRFMFLLAKNYHECREVDYYASELCITARYLSSVVKEKTGSSCLQWITDIVIRRAKALLKDNTLSIAQVSDELNFANPSFFGKYFKKHTGTTPKKFRDKEF